MKAPASLICVALTAAMVVAAPALAFDANRVVPATGTIEYAFTPGDDGAGLIVSAVERARTAIYVQAFSFTHKAIAQALIDAAARGVAVEVIADLSQISLIEHNVLPAIAASRARVFVDGEHTAAHNKVILVDPESPQAAVVTGSFNFTFAAQYRNAENILVLRGNRDLARAYLANWRLHRAHAAVFAKTPPTGSRAGDAPVPR